MSRGLFGGFSCVAENWLDQYYIKKVTFSVNACITFFNIQFFYTTGRPLIRFVELLTKVLLLKKKGK